MTETLVSKVLVLENDRSHAEAIKQFCERHHLVALSVREAQLMEVLGSNIDLGAIFHSQSYGATPAENLSIAGQIHSLRPELPIIYRCDDANSMARLDPALRALCCAVYRSDEMASLIPVIDAHIFSLVYPNALVRGISELTEAAFASQFRSFEVRRETPYVVRDRAIFGEVFSLIPLESRWCRGYMMLQTEEASILDVLRPARAPESPGFRDVNSLLGELTNLIWGAFKNRYIGDESVRSGGQIQVPLVVNHRHKYISFGTENPQLCFRYTLTAAGTGRCITFYQRFIFNLTWTPEEFQEIVHDDTVSLDAGALELF